MRTIGQSPQGPTRASPLPCPGRRDQPRRLSAMPAFRPPFEPDSSPLLGPQGPFPRIALVDPIERRWLHYAFLSRDRQLGLVANAAWLGPDKPGGATPTSPPSCCCTSAASPGWPASSTPASPSRPGRRFACPASLNGDSRLRLAASAGEPARRSSVAAHRPALAPASARRSPGNHHLRWQSEAGLRAHGDWHLNGRTRRDVDAIGYHERVRGRWGWPELGEWVFGFAERPRRQRRHSRPSGRRVFTFIRPQWPADATTASVMLWHRGRMRRHFPRRRVQPGGARHAGARLRCSRCPRCRACSACRPWRRCPSGW